MKNNQLRLYIHIPFCVQKCNYCDFLSFASTEDTRDKYVKKLIEEIHSWAEVGSSYEVQSLFIGGGTPSVLKPEQTADILEALYRSFVFAGNAEITTEANPGTINREKLDLYHALGINRISLGLQSAHDEELRMLGRIHSREEFVRNYNEVREAGFENVNIDLISGLPGQSLASWEDTLRQVVALEPEHISAYSLILEEGTPMGDAPQKWPSLPDEETERLMYEKTAALLSEFGYQQYEISNYAKTGYACAHNIGYWTGDPYVGFGLGVSSYFAGQRFRTEDSMERYLRGVSYYPVEKITEKEAMEEYMILGLRMTEGVSKEEFQQRFSIPLEKVFADVLQKHGKYGLLEEKGDRVRLTRNGISLSNRVLSDFFL